MNNRFLLVLILIFTMVIGVACSSSSSEREQDETSNQETEENAQKATDGDANLDTIEETDEEANLNKEEENSKINQDSGEHRTQKNKNQSLKDLPEPIILNEQIQHPEGLVFVLEKITFKEDHILVDFNAENHTGYHQHLASKGRARGENLGGITLVDDTGFVYRYIADDNDRIKLEDREKVTGTVSFTGTIQDDAESITLIFNPDHNFEFAFEDLELVW